MNISTVTLKDSQFVEWDQYACKHCDATVYHLSGWGEIIRSAYNHTTHYLMAKNTDLHTVVGILPMVHIRHRLLCNTLTSIPFFDTGGILADTTEVADVLIDEAMTKAKQLGVSGFELRHTENTRLRTDLHPELAVRSQSHKVRMVLELPDSSETLLGSFKAKLRNQIKVPIRKGLTAKIGGIDLLNDFYKVFAINMRDLGSPVHSRSIIGKTVEQFSNDSRIVMVYDGRTPVAGSVVVGFRDTLSNPWASALRQYKKLSPNMLLYWTMISYAADNGFRFFDFGRSTPDEGTFKFKQQWGAQPQPLHWQNLSHCPLVHVDKWNSRRGFSEKIWSRLPLHVTTIMGPMIRKYIPL